MDQTTVVQLATIIGPAVLAFLAGHFHVLLTATVAPAKPAVPVVPPVAPVTPAPVAVPANPILPVGQGGILQVLSIFLQTIASHPAGTPQEKNTAASAAISAIQPLLLAQVSSNIPSGA